MALVCNFLKPCLVSASLKYSLNFNIKQKCSLNLSNGKSFHNFMKVNMLKGILTYNCFTISFYNFKPFLISKSFANLFSRYYAHLKPPSSLAHPPLRGFCSGNQPKHTFPSMIGLSDLPVITTPSLFNSVRNWILTTFVIKPNFDNEFQLQDFCEGAVKAVELVTIKLSESDYDHLEGLIAEDLLSKIKTKLSACSLSQRQELTVDIKDIVFQYPYEIGIIFDEDSGEDKRFVEITMCYHILKGYGETMSKVAEATISPFNFKFPENDQVYVINCRFVREYTKGVQDQWTINALNYFVLSDIDKN